MKSDIFHAILSHNSILLEAVSPKEKERLLATLQKFFVWKFEAVSLKQMTAQAGK
jgi:hypothetical protein